MTIKDVAAHCGVSVSTVSRVLNNHPDVSKEVRAKVQQAIAELHYVPNNSARDLVASPIDAIGVVVRGSGNPFFTPVINAMDEEADKKGYTLISELISPSDDEIAAGAELVRSKRLKGIVFLGGRFDYTQDEVATLGVPFVCCSFDNRFGNLDESDYSSVSLDDTAEAYKATEYLLDHGHSKVAILLDSVDSNSIGTLRFRGYCAALKDRGIPTELELAVQTGDFSMAAAYDGTLELMRSHPDVTAIFSISDSMAIAAMKALSDLGQRVPKDVSVIAIDGIESSLYTVPTLTTLCQPQQDLGRDAVKVLLGVINEGARNEHLRIETTLRPGGTVGSR